MPVDLFTPLDVDFQFDPKIMRVGHVAESLYVRALALSKRTLTDGVIERVQLASLCLGLPGRATKHAQSLVDAGLWNEHRDGWMINSWFKWNASATDVQAKAARKKASSLRANHDRWHVGPGTKPSDTCSLCYPDSIRLGSTSDSALDSASESTSDGVRNPQYKTETETETEAIGITADETLLSQLPDSEEGSNRIKAIAKRYAEITYELGRGGINSPTGFKNGQYRKALTNPDCERLAREYPTAPVDVLACALNGDKHSLAYHERQAS